MMACSCNDERAGPHLEVVKYLLGTGTCALEARDNVIFFSIVLAYDMIIMYWYMSAGIHVVLWVLVDVVVPSFCSRSRKTRSHGFGRITNPV